jgi:hypothetical protein
MHGHGAVEKCLFLKLIIISKDEVSYTSEDNLVENEKVRNF